MAASPTTNFDTSRLRFGDMIAGVAGLVLFISLFIEWYSASVKTGFGSIGNVSVGGNAWDALGLIPILLTLCALVAIGVAVMRALGNVPRLAITPGMAVLAAGALATLLVLFRILVVPDGGAASSGLVKVDFGRSIGIFLALLAALAMLVGGWLTWGEEGKPRPGSAGAGAGAGGGPLGAGQQGGYGGPGAGTGATPAGGGFGGGAQQPFAQPQQQQPVEPVQTQAAQTGGQAKADWYPDPRGEKRLRYYDGTQWTEHTAD